MIGRLWAAAVNLLVPTQAELDALIAEALGVDTDQPSE